MTINNYMYNDFNKLIYDCAEERYGIPLPGNVINRINSELVAFHEHNFAHALMVAYDVIQYMKQNNILAGPGRGIIAGSIILYCLGVTDVDPLRYGLMFERLNEYLVRENLLDITIDCEAKNADKIKKYIVNKYGKSRTAFVMSIDEEETKKNINCYLKNNNIDSETAKIIKRAIITNDNPADIIKWKYSEEFLNRYREDVNIRELFDLVDYRRPIKLPDENLSCGVVITDDPLSDDILSNSEGNFILTNKQTYTEDALHGLFLKLNKLYNLDIVSACIKKIQKNKSIMIVPSLIPLDDEETFQYLSSSFFDLEWRPYSDNYDYIMPYRLMMKPENFNQLVDLVSLSRPIPVWKGIMIEYINRKNNPEKAPIIHPLLEPYISETYSILLYQEQFMRITQDLGGFSKNESNKFVICIARNSLDKIEEYKKEFMSHLSRITKNESEAEEIISYLWRMVNHFFLKSHAVPSSKIIYWLAYLKTHYEDEYMECVS